MTNLKITELLRNVASSYQYKNEKKYKFQIIAYNRAADSVEHSTSELKDLWDNGKLEEVPSIGPSIAKHLDEIFRTGKSKHFARLMQDIPKEAFTLMALPKVGIKTAIKMLDELPKSEINKNLETADKLINKTKRLLLPYAENIATSIIEWLKESPDVIKADVLGSLRRKCATVGDIDILVASGNPSNSVNQLISYPKNQKTIEQGEHTASILLPNNVQVNILVTTTEQYGSVLQREDARELTMSLSKLVQLTDIKADLHIHSDFDIETSHDLGISSMETIVNKAKELGYEYIAFTEHNPSKSGHSHERTIELLREKQEYIRERIWPIKVFNSLEIDINIDGSLPVPDKGLETLDFALVSIHSGFDLKRDEQTKRVLSALSYPKVLIFAHPTARKINQREGIELDWEKIFDFCLKNNKFLEINADPMRLDLPDTLVRDAIKLGVKLSLGTDTHEVSMMDNMKYGVYVARRGWCEKKNVVNCLSLEDFKKEVNIK